MMMTGVALMFSCIMKETYTPVLLQRKAARIRKETDDPRWWSRYDQKVALSEVLKINLTRPFIMAVVEPIWYVLPIPHCWISYRYAPSPASSGTSISPLYTPFSISALWLIQLSSGKFGVGLLACRDWRLLELALVPSSLLSASH